MEPCGGKVESVGLFDIEKLKSFSKQPIALVPAGHIEEEDWGIVDQCLEKYDNFSIFRFPHT